jgi:predicted dehydrogenase
MEPESMNLSPKALSRRAFLKGAAAAAAVPAFVPARVLGAEGTVPPSERITMGLIGIGGQGGYHLGCLTGFQEVQIEALCDVDAGHLKSAVERVDSAYAEARKTGSYKGCAAYRDFRELLARDDIDAVLIATPDHWHAAISMAAMEAGKDVYVEKPLSVCVAQGRAVCDAARRYRRVLQVGSHERSRSNARFACELVRNGRIGDLRRVQVNMPLDEGRGAVPPQPVMPVPEGLDWNLWLGPAPWAPYTEKRCHFSFRYIMDYAGGEMTDRGAHILDIGQLGMGMDGTGPVEVEGSGWRPPDGLFDTFFKYRFAYRYANGVEMVGTDQGPRGLRFEGTKGWVFVHIHGGDLEAEPASLLKERIGPGEIHLGRSPGHHQDFLAAVRNRGQVMAPVEAGHRTATLCHLANIAMLTGRKLAWDPVAERITNCPEADRMLSRPARAPWVV